MITDPQFIRTALWMGHFLQWKYNKIADKTYQQNKWQTIAMQHDRDIIQFYSILRSIQYSQYGEFNAGIVG